jgi:hypothetical protein
MATETFQTVKLPASLFAELGATPADFADKFAAFLADSKAAKLSLASAEAAATVTASAGVDMAARLDAVEKSVAAFLAVDSAAILASATAAAKVEASSVASAILAKSGGAPLVASVPVEPGKPAANKIARADFSKLSANEQSRFCREGGSVVD